MSSASSKKGDDLDDIEMLIDAKGEQNKCIDSSPLGIQILFVFSFFFFCFSYFGIWYFSLPQTITQYSSVDLKPTRKPIIPLTFTIHDLNSLYRKIDVSIIITRDKGKYHKLPKLISPIENLLTINLINETKTSTILNQISSNAVFDEFSLNSKPVPLFSHEIDCFEAVELLLHLKKEIPIKKITFEWKIDSPMKRGKTSAAQISFFALLLFSLISFLLNKPSDFLDHFLVVILILAVFAVNPFSLFIDFTLTLDYLTPVFISFFIHLSKLFAIQSIRRLLPLTSPQTVSHDVLQRQIKPIIVFLYFIISLITSYALFVRYNTFNITYHPFLSKLSLILCLVFEFSVLIYLIYLVITAMRKTPSSNLYFPLYCTSISSFFASFFVMLLEYLGKIIPNIYTDLMLFVSVYINAACFHSFMRLNINPKSKTMSTHIKKNYQLSDY